MIEIVLLFCAIFPLVCMSAAGKSSVQYLYSNIKAAKYDCMYASNTRVKCINDTIKLTKRLQAVKSKLVQFVPIVESVCNYGNYYEIVESFKSAKQDGELDSWRLFIAMILDEPSFKPIHYLVAIISVFDCEHEQECWEELKGIGVGANIKKQDIRELWLQIFDTKNYHKSDTVVQVGLQIRFWFRSLEWWIENYGTEDDVRFYERSGILSPPLILALRRAANLPNGHSEPLLDGIGSHRDIMCEIFQHLDVITLIFVLPSVSVDYYEIVMNTLKRQPEKLHDLLIIEAEKWLPETLILQHPWCDLFGSVEALMSFYFHAVAIEDAERSWIQLIPCYNRNHEFPVHIIKKLVEDELINGLTCPLSLVRFVFDFAVEQWLEKRQHYPAASFELCLILDGETAWEILQTTKYPTVLIDYLIDFATVDRQLKDVGVINYVANQLLFSCCDMEIDIRRNLVDKFGRFPRFESLPLSDVDIVSHLVDLADLMTINLTPLLTIRIFSAFSRIASTDQLPQYVLSKLRPVDILDTICHVLLNPDDIDEAVFDSMITHFRSMLLWNTPCEREGIYGSLEMHIDGLVMDYVALSNCFEYK